MQLWLILTVLRVAWCLLPQYGYIHPDEFFQTVEIVAGDVLDVNVHTAWEFNSSRPLRSATIPQVLFSPLFQALRFSNVVTPYLVLVTPRIAMTMMTIVAEFYISRTAQKLGFDPNRCHLLLASSYISVVYLTRTFSNSIEYLLFAFLFHQCEHDGSSFVISLLLSLGVFNRPTFVAFASIPTLKWLSKAPWKRSLNCAINGAAISSLIVLCDTLYFTGSFTSNFIVTPFNFLVYNTQTSNLAEHGIHPLYTHLIVNTPLLFGPLALTFITHKNIHLCLSYFIPLLFLSAFPHQEPRFLLPLLIPICVMHSRNKPGLTWFIFNALAALFYGGLHQAGVVKSLIHSPAFEDHSHLVFYKTYMPPRHLALQPHSSCVQNVCPSVSVHDLMGATLTSLKDHLNEVKKRDSSANIFLLAPATLKGDLSHFTKIASFCPHLSTENLPVLKLNEGIVNGFYELIQDMCLNVYDVKF